ncbi:MAG: MBG domain-containing protein, partial [Pseudomonadales bacterium]|nr:MBG domain-containing protein [Pseudomonadales bacterium]
MTVPAGLTVTTTYTGHGFATAAAIVGVEAVDEVLYVAGDTIPDGKKVGDVKTAAVTAVTAVPAVISPSGAGDYAVSVSVVDDNYSGSDTATLTIGSVVINNTAVTYTGAAQAPSVTLVPSDLTHTVTYTDSSGGAVASPTKADTYTVLVAVSDTRYPGDISTSYTINPAALTADLGGLSTVYGLDAPSATDWAATLTYTGFVGGETASTDVVAAVAAVAEVLYVTGDTLPTGAAVGDVKTAAVAAVPAVPAVVTTGLSVSYDRAVSVSGSYVATPAGLSSSNYAITYSDGALTVNKMATTIALTNTSQ